MIHQLPGLISSIYAVDRPFFKLLMVFSVLFFTQNATAEVRLKGVSVEPGAPGSWTVARVRVQNSDGDGKKLELRWTLGAIETSVFEQKMEVFLPAESVRMVWAPVWIPKDIMKNSAQKNNNKGKKQRSFYEVTVLLFENGAQKSRETALGTLEDLNLMRGMNLGRNRDKNHKYDPLADMRPTDGAVLPEVVGWGKNRWVYKQRADEIQGYSYLFPDLLDRKSILWIQKGYDQQQGLWNVLKWVERGGLLIIDPMDQSELGPLGSMLEVQVGLEVWNDLKKVNWKLDGTRPLSGRVLHTSGEWSRVVAEKGVQVAAVRSWGLGKIVLLNYRWNALVGTDRERAKKILEDLHPKGFSNEFKSNHWNEAAKNSLVMRHGNQIWSRDTVMMYLGSLMLFSLILWAVPFFRKRSELRWGIWTLGMLAWTGAGLGAFLNKTSSGAKFSSEIISYGKSGGEVEKLQGYSVFYSESLRKFPLTYSDGVDVTRLTSAKSSRMTKSSEELSYDDFGLQPMRINLLKWSRSREVTLPKVEVKWGDDLELTIPKELHGLPIALVIGRTIWESKATQSLKLKVNDGKAISNRDGASDLELTAYRLSRQASDNRGSLGTQRNWLIYQSNAKAPMGFPNDIAKEENHIRVLEIEPKYTKGNFAMGAGMSEWTFRRGKGVKTWKTNDLGFDGLAFKTENVNMSLGWRFEVPQAIRSRLKAQEVSLKVAEVPESVTPNTIWVKVKGKTQRVTVENGRAKLPKDAIQNGSLEIEIRPPLPKVGATSMMRPPWKPWVQGLELKGTLQ